MMGAIDNHVEGIMAALGHGGGTHTLADLVDEIDAGRAQLWRTNDAVIVTEVNDTPQHKVLHFWIATGDLEEVIRLSEVAIEWGKSVGCTRATLAGRRGWVKALADHGWAEELTVMGREIS